MNEFRHRDPRRQYDILWRSLQHTLDNATSLRFPQEKRNRKLRRRMEDNLIFELKSALRTAKEIRILGEEIEDLYPEGPDHFCFQCKERIFQDGEPLDP